jgi:DNA-binding beta-propeller fold protein YncE
VKVFRVSDYEFECELISELGVSYGVCIANEQLFVSECHADRVLVFTLEGEHVRTFGRENGQQDEQLNCPVGVHFDGKLLYVADCYNHRVQVFTADGQFVGKFGEYGMSEDGYFNCPRSVTSDDEHIYVSDETNRIQVFSKRLVASSAAAVTVVTGD